MAIELKIDRERNLAVYTLTGDVTVEEVKEVVKCFGESLELTKNLLMGYPTGNLPKTIGTGGR